MDSTWARIHLQRNCPDVGADLHRVAWVRWIEPVTLRSALCRFAGVVFKDAAEVVLAEEFVRFRRSIGRRRIPQRHTVADPLMGPECVIIPGVLLDKMIQVVLAEDDEMIKDFLFDRLNHALTMSIEVRAVNGEFHRFDSRRGKDPVELFRELGVAVVNEESRLDWPTVKHFHRGVAGLLSHPGRVGMRRPSRDPNLASLDMNKDQHVHLHRPAQRPDMFGEEVTSPERAGMPSQEVPPGSNPAPWSGINADPSEDVPNGGNRRRLKSQPTQLPLNPSITPAGFTAEFDDQQPHFGRGPRSAVCLGGRINLLLGRHPTAERAWRDNGNEILDRRSQRRPKLEQLPPLGRSDSNCLGEPFAEDAILDLQVLRA